MTVNRKKFPHEAKDYYYTDLMVLRSPAGFYIGRLCWDKAAGFEEPLSRESGYLPTKDEAERVLREGFVPRDCVENNAAYAKGDLPRVQQPWEN